MNNGGSILGVICLLILILIIVIKLAPVLSDLQTTYRAKEIVDNAKNKDISETTEEFANLTIDTAESTMWSMLWAPIIGFVILGLTTLYTFLKKQIS